MNEGSRLRRGPFVVVGQFLLSLFPDDGFQGRMRATASAATPDVLEFAFVDATNMIEGSGRATTMTFRSADEIVQTWHWRADGKDSAFDITLRRKAHVGP